MMCACAFKVNNGASEKGRQTAHLIDTALKKHKRKELICSRLERPIDLCSLFNANNTANPL